MILPRINRKKKPTGCKCNIKLSLFFNQWGRNFKSHWHEQGGTDVAWNTKMTGVFFRCLRWRVDSEESRDVTVRFLARCLYMTGHLLLSVSFLMTASQVRDSTSQFSLVYRSMGLFPDLDPDPLVVLVAPWLNNLGFPPVDGVVLPFAVVWF